jgi:plastocyanin
MLKTVSLFLALLASTALADNHGWHHKPTTWKVKVGGAELKYDPPFVHAQKGDTVRFVL